MPEQYKPPAGPIKSVRVPRSDVDAASLVTPPRQATTDNSRRFAIMGAAILEKLCRSGKLAVHSKNTTPYILDTANGRVAVSVMVSAVSGDPSTKHMIVPINALGCPPGVNKHVVVCAFVDKRERVRETNGGLNVKLAGWASTEEVVRFTRENTRINTSIRVASVPVSALHPIQTLRHYLTPTTNKENNKCENHA